MVVFRRHALATQPIPAVGSETAFATLPVILHRAGSMTPRIARRKEATNRSRPRLRPAADSVRRRSARLAPALRTIPADGPTMANAMANASMSCPAPRSTIGRTASPREERGRAAAANRGRARSSSRAQRDKSRMATFLSAARQQTWIEARSTRHLRCSTSTDRPVGALRWCTTLRWNQRFRGIACTCRCMTSSATMPRNPP